MKKIIATSWHPGGTEALIPVVKKLKEDKGLETVVVAHDYSEQLLKKEGIPYRTIKDYGISEITLDSMKELLEQEKQDLEPSLVITGTSSPNLGEKDAIEKNLILAAKESDIKTISLLDFWSEYVEKFSNMTEGIKFQYLPDKIAVLDEYAKDEMIELGFPPKKLVVTGNPSFDGLEKMVLPEDETERIRKKYGDNDLLFFYAANAFRSDDHGYWDLDNIELLEHALYGKADLVIKLHPRMPEDEKYEIKEYLQLTDMHLEYAKDPLDLILASDVTFTPFSTLGVKAAYMGKPIISLQPGIRGRDWLHALTAKAIIPVGYDKETCRTLIEKSLDPDYREEIKRNLEPFKSDGKATERVLKLIYDSI